MSSSARRVNTPSPPSNADDSAHVSLGIDAECIATPTQEEEEEEEEEEKETTATVIRYTFFFHKKSRHDELSRNA